MNQYRWRWQLLLVIDIHVTGEEGLRRDQSIKMGGWTRLLHTYSVPYIFSTVKFLGVLGKYIQNRCEGDNMSSVLFLFVIQAFLDTLKLKNHPVNFAFLIYKLPSMLMPVSSFSKQRQIIQYHCHPKQPLFKIWTKNAPRVKHLQIKIRGNVLPSIPKGSQSDLILPDGSRIHITKALNTWALPLPPCWMSTLRSNWVSEKHSLWWDTPDISSPTRM